MNIHKNARLTPRGREGIVFQVASGRPEAATAHPDRLREPTRASRSLPKQGLATAVSRVLQWMGLNMNKLSALEPAEPVDAVGVRTLASLSTLISKKLGHIGSVGHRVAGRYLARLIVTTVSVGSSSMSASTMPSTPFS